MKSVLPSLLLIHVLVLQTTLLLVDATYPSIAVTVTESKQLQQQHLTQCPDENDIRGSQEPALAPLRLLCKGVSSKFCSTTNAQYNSHNVVTRLYLDYVLQHQMDDTQPIPQKQQSNTCSFCWEAIAPMAMSCLITVCCFIEAFLEWSWNVEFTLLTVGTVVGTVLFCRHFCVVVTCVPKNDKRRKNH